MDEPLKPDWQRFDRQLPLEGIGQAGQEKLSQAHVTIVGVGGLGSAAALYLAAAGIGHLHLIDSDSVEPTNLNRQILHTEKSLGHQKVLSAAARLSQLNSTVVIHPQHERIDADNVHKSLAESTLVLDCLDNFSTRYILNRAIVGLEKPLVHGACRGFEGRVTVIVPGRSACLKCIVPNPPPPETVPILGTTAGIIGVLQAQEAIKVLLGIGEPLIGRLLLFDGLKNLFRIITVDPDPDCPICAKTGKNENENEHENKKEKQNPS